MKSGLFVAALGVVSVTSLSVPEAANSQPLTIPLIKRGNIGNGPGEVVQWDLLHKALEKAKTKYTIQFSSHLNKRQTVEPLVDQVISGLDIEYYGPVQFGTPPQTMQMDFDTGSADIWIPGQGCIGSCSKNLFDAAKSTTAKDLKTPFAIKYIKGEASGSLFTDVVAIGNLSFPNQAVAIITNASADFGNSLFDGVFGMGYSSLAVSKKPTFFENLVNANLVPQGVFGVSLARGSKGKTGSELILGGYNKVLAGDKPNFFPVIDKSYWTINFDSVSVNGTVVYKPPTSTPVNGSNYAIMDTGTSLILASQSIVTEFYAGVPGAKISRESGGFYTFPCNSNLNVTFTFSGKSYPMAVDDFNLGPETENSTACVGAIAGANLGTSKAWILGDSFLKSVYTIFDLSNNQVGLTSVP